MKQIQKIVENDLNQVNKLKERIEKSTGRFVNCFKIKRHRTVFA